jgi:hypothetical protein
VFRRRGKQGDDELEPSDALEDSDAETAAADTVLPAPPPRPTGPWDVADMPRDDVERVDLGGLLIPVAGGHELRVDLDPASGTVVSITLATPTSLMQVAGFAAPRSAGIWAEIREEITESVTTGGGSAHVADGPYGAELRAMVPTETPGELAPARFLGVDGPRWFVRAMVQGQAATDPTADADLVAAFAQVVVVRGGDAMAVRDALPLRLPPDVAGPAAEAAAAAAAEQQAQQPTAESLLERPPLNTETR